jgi:hypothetical protein
MTPYVLWQLFNLEEDSGLVLPMLDAPVTSHQCLVEVTGSVLSGLVLTTLIDLSESAAGGWFLATTDTIRAITGMTDTEVIQSMNALVKAGFIHRQSGRGSEFHHLQIDWDKILFGLEDLCDAQHNFNHLTHVATQRSFSSLPTQLRSH